MGGAEEDLLLQNESFASMADYNYTYNHDPFIMERTIFQERVMDYLQNQLLGPSHASTEILLPMCFSYVVIFITGVIGNSVTIWVISRNPRMHTGGTNFYLINLAISDLLSLILGLPFEVYQLFEEYPYPFVEPFCQARAWVSEASTYSSVFTILAFTIERYIAICHPFKNIHFRTKSSRVILTIIVSWILAVTAAAPIGLEFGILRFPYPNDTWAAEVAGEPILESSVCTAPPEGAMSILVQFSTFVFFLLPMVVIIFLHIIIAVHLRRSTYMTRIAASSENIHNHHNNGGKSSQPQQGRQSVLKMLVAVALAFFVCYAPHHVQRMHAVYETHWDSSNMYVHRVLTYISGVFYYGASTVNPFLYSILSARFRKAYRSTLCFCICPNSENFQRENFSAHSFNSQACSLRYRPSTSNDELSYLGTRQNSLDKNGLRTAPRNPGNGHIKSRNVGLLWTTPKYLSPRPVSKDTLVVYFPKKKHLRRKRKNKLKTKEKLNTKATNDGDHLSSISSSSLQENHIDMDQVSGFLNGGLGWSLAPRLVIHPPSSSGSGKSES